MIRNYIISRFSFLPAAYSISIAHYDFSHILIFSSNQFTLQLHSVEKYFKTRSRFLSKNQHFFREINVFPKELISRIFLA